MKGSIRNRGRKSWELTVDIGVDPVSGRRKRKFITVRGTKREAESELRRVLGEIETGTFVEPSKMTVDAYLTLWLNENAKVKVAPKTLERYQQLLDHHVRPRIGTVLLQKLTPNHIQACYTHALESGRRRSKGGLSPQTVLHIHRVLHDALERAVKRQLLVRNPAKAAEAPRVPKQEMRVLDEAETVRLLTSLNGHSLYAPVVVAVTTGLRRGELLALRWSDVDLDAGHLRVGRSLEQTKGGLRFKEVKTARGKRTIPLMNLTVKTLRSHRARQAEEKLLLGPAYTAAGWSLRSRMGLCGRPTASPRCGANWQRERESPRFGSMIFATRTRANFCKPDRT